MGVAIRALRSVVFLASACGSKESTPTPTPAPGPDPFDNKNAPPVAAPVTPDAAPAPPAPDPIPTSTPCDQLSRSKCLRSDHCTLELVGQNVYRCRPDKGSCEVGIHQQNRKECQAVAGCTFEQNDCYCSCEGHARTETVDEPSGGCGCACGGGKPPACVESKKATPAPAAPAPAPAPVPAPASASLTWSHDERAAFADAKARGKGVMIDFAAEWCAPCKELERRFNSPPIAAEITASFVLLRFDVSNGTDADDAAQTKYDAPTLPAVIFVDANGTELGRLKDAVPAEMVLDAVRSAATKLKK